MGRLLTEKDIMRSLNKVRPLGIYHVRTLGRDFRRDVFPLLEEEHAKSAKEERRDVARWLQETCYNGNHNKIFRDRERIYCTTCIEQGCYKLERGEIPWMAKEDNTQ